MPEVGTKRSTEVDDYGVTKQPKEGNIKLRILIKGHYSGALIGKGGENFKRLREQFGVKITGLSSREEERVLQLDGDRNDIYSILKELLPLCPEAPFTSQSQRSASELNILVNTGQVGAVIGKAGAKMKEIREQCGGGIKVFPDCLPNSSERVVAMGGDDESVVLCQLEMVLAVLDNAAARTPTMYYDPSKRNEFQTNTQVNHFQQSASAYSTSAPSSNVEAASIDVAQILLTRQEMKLRNPLPALNDFGQIQTVTTLTVPNLMCGAIIGKAGMNVKQVKMASGVSKIDFSPNESGDTSADRTITITGTQDQIQIAEQLMSQYVQNSHNVAKAI